LGLGRFSFWNTALLLALCAATAQAQDERRVVSPNGQLEFRLFVSQPGSDGLPQLAYQVRYHGRVAIETSFLGLNIHEQEPMLGENDGLIASHPGAVTGPYRSLIADYMQNGSIGRLINIEVRVWDDTVAFRYIIPPSTALMDILIDDELTEFAIAGSAQPTGLNPPVAFALPGDGWIGISEVAKPGFSPMELSRARNGVLVAHLAREASNPRLAYQGKPPLVCPWRVLTFAADREHALHPSRDM